MILDDVYPDLAVRVYRVYEDMERYCMHPMRATNGYRSFDEQAICYAQGRTEPGDIVTWARPGDSLHQYGLAVDSCFQGKDPYLTKVPKALAAEIWAQYGKMAEAHGLTWGGRWLSHKTDHPHIQISYGLTLNELKMLYTHGGIKEVWKHLDEKRKV